MNIDELFKTEIWLKAHKPEPATPEAADQEFPYEALTPVRVRKSATVVMPKRLNRITAAKSSACDYIRYEVIDTIRPAHEEEIESIPVDEHPLDWHCYEDGCQNIVAGEMDVFCPDCWPKHKGTEKASWKYKVLLSRKATAQKIAPPPALIPVAWTMWAEKEDADMQLFLERVVGVCDDTEQMIVIERACKLAETEAVCSP